MHSWEHDFEHKDHRLSIEHATLSELKTEVAQKEQLATNLLEVHQIESALSVMVEKIQRKASHLKKEMSTSQQEATGAKREATQAMEEVPLLKTELPKRLEESVVEAIENFQGSE